MSPCSSLYHRYISFSINIFECSFIFKNFFEQHKWLLLFMLNMLSYVTMQFAPGRLIVVPDEMMVVRRLTIIRPQFLLLFLFLFFSSLSADLFLAPPTHWRSICLADRNPCSPSRYHHPPPPPHLAITSVKGPSEICNISDDVFHGRRRPLLLRLAHKHKPLPVLIQFTAPE